MGAGERLGRGLIPAGGPPGAVGTHGRARSLLFGFWISLICDACLVLTWNQIQSGPGASSSSDCTHTGTQPDGRPGYMQEDLHPVPQAGDLWHLGSSDTAVFIELLYHSYFDWA